MGERAADKGNIKRAGKRHVINEGSISANETVGFTPFYLVTDLYVVRNRHGILRIFNLAV